MKRILIPLFLVLSILLSCSGKDVEEYIPNEPNKPSEPEEDVIYHARAKELFDLINQYYGIKTDKPVDYLMKTILRKVAIILLPTYGHTMALSRVPRSYIDGIFNKLSRFSRRF